MKSCRMGGHWAYWPSGVEAGEVQSGTVAMEFSGTLVPWGYVYKELEDEEVQIDDWAIMLRGKLKLVGCVSYE